MLALEEARGRILAALEPTPAETVARSSRVISSRTGCFGFSAKRTSRLVRIPTSFPPFSTTGIPEIAFIVISACASASVARGSMVIGLTTIPLSKRLT